MEGGEGIAGGGWPVAFARHDALRTAGVVLFGIRHVDAHVPPLYSATREVAVDGESDDQGKTDDKPTG